jgi:hypothetical protein
MLWNANEGMMTKDESKLEILKKVEDGTLTIEEGSDLLGILEKGDPKQSQPVVIHPDRALPPMDPMEKPTAAGCWKAGWSLILLAGAVLTGFSAYWVYQGYKNNGFGWGFWLSWIPMALGVLIMIAGWGLLESPWMHVRVHSKGESKRVNIVFSMPIPLRFVRWIFRTFGGMMPAEVKDKGIEEMLDAMETSIKNGDPFHVQVDDDGEDSKVEVFIA